MKLTKISLQDLPALRDSFKVDWPKHVVSYATIQTLIEKLKRNPQLSSVIEILTLDGDWTRDSTFILHFIENNFLLIGTLEDAFERLMSALTLLDFNMPLKFGCFREEYRPMLCEIVRTKNPNFVLSNDDLTFCYHLPKGKVCEFDNDTPDGFELRSLTVDDVEVINYLWPHRFPGSEFYLSNLIRTNISLGLFNVANNEIVGWALWNEMGALGLLHVIEKYKKRGFGTLLVKNFSKLAIETYDVDITAHVLIHNDVSQKLFEKLGFVRIHRNSWVGLKDFNKT